MNSFVFENSDGPSSAGCMFDPNDLKHQAFATRQPSYLRAVGVLSPQNGLSDTTKEPLVASHKSRAPVPRFEVWGSKQLHTAVQDMDASSIDFCSQNSPFCQQAVGFDSIPVRKSKHSRFRQPVDGFADERQPSAADSCERNVSRVQSMNEQGSFVKCHPDGQDFMMLRNDIQPDIYYGCSAVMPAQKVKQIPRAVIAPMSRTEIVERHYPMDKFSSLPKTLKMTHTDKRNPLKDSMDIELSMRTSKPFGAMIPAADKSAVAGLSNSACNLAKQQDLCSGHGASSLWSQQLSTAEHSGIAGKYVHPSFYTRRLSDVVKPKTVDDIYDGQSYIHPQTVESVLSYQNLARKSCGNRCRKDVIPGVYTGRSRPVVAPNDVNRNLAPADIRPVCWSSNEIVSMPITSVMPVGKTSGGDRSSASSTSTTCSSHLDSGYCGDHRDSASWTSTSQSPELLNLGLVSPPFNSSPVQRSFVGHCSVDVLCQAVNCESDQCSSTVRLVTDATSQAGDSHFNHLGMLQATESPKIWSQHHENIGESLPSLPLLSEVHSLVHEEAPSARWPHMLFSSDADLSNSMSDYKNNRHLNMMPVSERKQSGTEMIAVGKPTDVHRMVAGEYATKPGIENTTEQMKYLSMLQKQIKLYRVKDEENMRMGDGSGQKFAVHNAALLRTLRLPDTQADINTIQSSCFDLEKVTHDLVFESTVPKPGSSKICGSTDLNRCKPHQVEMGDNVYNLILKKKAFEQRRVGLGAVEELNIDGQRASFLRPESTEYNNSADDYARQNDFQRLELSERQTNAELNSICRSAIVGGKHGKSPQKWACSLKSDADFSSNNSAEDIVNTWMLLKNERKSQVRENDNSVVPITSPTVENFKSSPVSAAPSEAKKFQFPPDHDVAPTSDSNCQRNKIGKQVKKSVSFSDHVALIASTEEVPNKTVDYVEYVTSFLQKRTSGLKSFEVNDDRSSQCESSSRGSLSSESRSDSSGSRSNSNVSVPESSGSNGDRDSDFYENDGSECSEEDSEGTIVDETGRIRCSLCHKRWIHKSCIYCKDCSFYMSKFQQAA